MRLLCRDNIGAPVAMLKVHPSRSRLVGFSTSHDEALLWGWGAGRLKQLARLGTRRDYMSTRTIRVFGRELEFPGRVRARDADFHPDGVYMATVGEGRPIEVYRVFDGQPMRTIVDRGFAFGPNGRRLYGRSGSGQILAHDAVTGKDIERWEAHAGLVTTLDIQHRTGTLVSGGLDGEVKVWALSDEVTATQGPLPGS